MKTEGITESFAVAIGTAIGLDGGNIVTWYVPVLGLVLGLLKVRHTLKIHDLAEADARPPAANYFAAVFSMTITHSLAIGVFVLLGKYVLARFR